MNILFTIFDFIIHIDKHLLSIIQEYGSFTYLILFLIIFFETGLVITPLLPGDSLLFVAGAFAATYALKLWIVLILLTIAAVLGDTVNYWTGYYFGSRLFENNRLFRKEYLLRTQDFYDTHGGKTIVIARFMPIIRTFAPFVAGIGKMNYARFLFYNVLGAVLWVSIFVLAGFYFGSIQFIKENLTMFVFIIIGLSIVPIIYQYIKNKFKR